MTSTTYARRTDTLPRTRAGSTGTSTVSRRPSARGTALVAAGIVAVAAISAGVGYRLHESATATTTSGGTTVARSDAAESGHGRGAAISTGTGVPVAAAVGARTTADAADSLVLMHGQAGSLALASGVPVPAPAGATLDVGSSTASGPGADTDGALPAHGTEGSVVTSSGPIAR